MDCLAFSILTTYMFIYTISAAVRPTKSPSLDDKRSKEEMSFNRSILGQYDTLISDRLEKVVDTVFQKCTSPGTFQYMYRKGLVCQLRQSSQLGEARSFIRWSRSDMQIFEVYQVVVGIFGLESGSKLSQMSKSIVIH